MATIPRIQKKPEPPKPPLVRTYSVEEMTAFGWLSPLPIDYQGAVPRQPDPRIPDGPDPRLSQKDETP